MPTEPLACTWSRSIHERTLMNRSARCLALLMAPILLLATACGAAPDPTAGIDGEETAMGHIHGIGVDPADGTLYAATHFGLFRVEDQTVVRVADRWQDTMAFTVVGDHHFLGSGHPDLREDLPPHLGLIESSDAGGTWQSLALQGEADFHAIEAAEDQLYAYDAVTETLMASSDMRTFRTVTRLNATDLAADPSDVNRVLATTPAGLVAVEAVSGRQTPIEAPGLAYVDWPRPDLLVGLSPNGDVQVSTGAGTRWTEAGNVPGEAAALEVTTEDWYAATDRGLFRSVDRGATWEPIVTTGS